MTTTEKLLAQLSQLAKRGPLLAEGHGSNSVGKTLQLALGLTHKVTTRNTLLGYTISATSNSNNSSARTNLFACVPDWASSPSRSANEIVKKFGRPNPTRGYSMALFCTVSSVHPNSFGLYLKVNDGVLEERHVGDGIDVLVAQWDTLKLEKKLISLGKHAIVQALLINSNKGNKFHYRFVDLLDEVIPDVFMNLISEGVITIDHLISLKAGATNAREQGPLFKIRGDSKYLLHSSSRRIDLLSY
jgi:hypothetical protein